MKNVLSGMIAIGLLVTAAVASAQTATRLTDDPIYKKNCSKCHGKTAEGRHFGGPSLSREKTTEAPADDLRDMIENGKDRMPKFKAKLKAGQIETLVHEIKAEKR